MVLAEISRKWGASHGVEDVTGKLTQYSAQNLRVLAKDLEEAMHALKRVA